MILLLSCSAIYLVTRTQSVILGSSSGGDLYPTAEGQQTPAEDGGTTARPLRMAAAIQRGGEVVHYGVQYNQEGTDALFQQAYSLLLEALSSAGQPQMVDEEAWQQALSTAPGIYFDWQGEVPLTVLSQWLSVTTRRSPGRCGEWCLQRWMDRCCCTIGTSPPIRGVPVPPMSSVRPPGGAGRRTAGKRGTVCL